jgi:hypothetical protein
MEHWMEGVRQVLARAPTGTLAYSQVLQELARENHGESPDPRWLLNAVAGRKDLFRVVPFPMGPWARWLDQVQMEGSGCNHRSVRDDPWILLLRIPETGIGPAESVLDRLRRGLREWGRALDEGSPVAVARWIRANREAARAWKAIMSRRA